jgi:G:T-mismatch repair DNA endonuclease (very short patch repair protein)
LPGRPDFVFRKERVAVFVDGDFWHGNPRKFRLPKSNLSYWGKKIFSNRARDKRINKALRKSGWVVVRFWQTSLRNENLVIERLRRYLNLNPQISEKRNHNVAWTDSGIHSTAMVVDEPASYASRKDTSASEATGVTFKSGRTRYKR